MMVNKRVRNAVLGCSLKNDRMISVRFQGKPFNIMVIHVCAPTSNAEEAEVEWFYEDLQDLLELTPKKDVLFIQGTGMQKQEVKKYLEQQARLALQYKMKQGKGKTEFGQENALVIANTLVQQYKTRHYTWTSPDGEH